MQAGFWMVLGLASGMLLSDVLQVRKVEAGGSTSLNEEYRIATGINFETKVDAIWLLDYKTAELQCIMLDAQRPSILSSLCKIDLAEQFEIPEGSRTKPKFLMVTGGYGPRNTDVCYVAETTSGQILCIMPPFALGRSGNKALNNPKQLVVARLKWREAGEVRGGAAKGN
jgi:hypothetical protein